jgi:hypothetical protein
LKLSEKSAARQTTAIYSVHKEQCTLYIVYHGVENTFPTVSLSERKERYKSYEEELEGKGETQKSLSDEESRLMAANGKMDVCYHVQTAVDAKNKLVAEFEVTNAGTDHNQLTPMAERTKTALGTEKLTVVADAGYNSVRDLVDSGEFSLTFPACNLKRVIYRAAEN